MWSIVEKQAELAKTRERYWDNPSLLAMVFAFHATEAYLNYVGLRLAPDYRSRKTRAPLRRDSSSRFRGAVQVIRRIQDETGVKIVPAQLLAQTKVAQYFRSVGCRCGAPGRQS
jgi:hypothetical protein